MKYNRRLGVHPYIKEVDKIEAMDIDYPEDFDICNAIYKEMIKKLSVQITDCTIRDGGYLFNKNSNPEFIKWYYAGISGCGHRLCGNRFFSKQTSQEKL